MRTWTAIAVTVALAAGCGNDGDGTQTGSAGMTTTGTSGESSGGTTAASTTEPTTGSSGEVTTGTGTTDATTGTTDATTGMTTATTGEACISCAESFMGADGELCPASKLLNQAVFNCVCMEACADVCKGACTMGQAPDMTCQTCQNGAITMQCAREFTACINDK